MYIGHSFKLAEMEIDERRRVAARFRLIREGRGQTPSARGRRLPAVLDGLRQIVPFGRWARSARPA